LRILPSQKRQPILAVPRRRKTRSPNRPLKAAFLQFFFCRVFSVLAFFLRGSTTPKRIPILSSPFCDFPKYWAGRSGFRVKCGLKMLRPGQNEAQPAEALPANSDEVKAVSSSFSGGMRSVLVCFAIWRPNEGLEMPCFYRNFTIRPARPPKGRHGASWVTIHRAFRGVTKFHRALSGCNGNHYYGFGITASASDEVTSTSESVPSRPLQAGAARCPPKSQSPNAGAVKRKKA